MKDVTMKDIAERLGISVVSVSNALSNRNGVSNDVRQRVIGMAESLGYQNNVSDVDLRGNNTVGIIIAERYIGKYASFYWSMYNKLSKRLAKQGYFGILEILLPDAEKNLDTPNVFSGASCVSGVIVLGQVNEKYLRMLDRFDGPLILLDFYTEHTGYDTITTDNFYSSYLITNHLISQGHQKIAYVGDIHATSSILDRYLGYCKSIIEHNLTIKDDWQINDRNQEGAFIRLELPSDMPTAFVCSCDEVAYNMIERLKEQGYNVPKDISVVGFDNYIYSKISKPQITTVKVDSDAMTTTCVECMLNKIKHSDYYIGKKIIVGDLVFRDSVGQIELCEDVNEEEPARA